MKLKTIAASGAIAAAAIAGCGTASSHPIATNHPVSPAAATSAPATTPPAPTPSPAGTGSGSCSYTLAPGIYGNDHLVGEVDLTNTGNVGIIVRVKIAWPQEGFAPIVMIKTARVPYGVTGLPVRFNYPTPTQGNVVTNLQNWEQGHNFPGNDCKYRETITGTFGQAH